MVGVGTRPVLLDTAVTVSVCVSFVAPELMPEKDTVIVAFPLETFVFTSLIGSSVGGSLTALTVTLNDVLAVAEPSFTVRVMRVVPAWSRAGMRVTVRLDPLPSRKIFVLATRTVLVEVAVTSSLNGAVSASETVNGMVRGVSSLTN